MNIFVDPRAVELANLNSHDFSLVMIVMPWGRSASLVLQGVVGRAFMGALTVDRQGVLALPIRACEATKCHSLGCYWMEFILLMHLSNSLKIKSLVAVCCVLKVVCLLREHKLYKGNGSVNARLFPQIKFAQSRFSIAISRPLTLGAATVQMAPNSIPPCEVSP